MIKHKIVKKKTEFLAIVFLALLSAIHLMFVYIAEVSTLHFGADKVQYYILVFGITFVLMGVVTRPRNRQMFEPYEYEEIEHVNEKR